jgi:cytochrome c oxidase subunit 1
VSTTAGVRTGLADEREHGEDGGLVGWLTTTDHKRIGLLYITTSYAMFLLGGLMALAMRAELASPGIQFVDRQTYSELFTMHGTIMLLLFGTPMGTGLANYIVPLQIGAADVAFPRLNALAYWLFTFGALIVLIGFFSAGGAAAAGWTGYAPLTDSAYEPGVGLDLWIVGLALVGISSVLGAINLISTIFGLRAPGMGMFRMPIFTWNILVTSILILFAFPPLTAAFAMLFIERNLGGVVFEPARGGDAVLWQHIFWFFGHPEVYILILPFFGVITEIISVFSRKPVFGYAAFVLATVSIASLSMAVWAHHMFTTGAVNLPFFSLLSFAIAVPTGIKFFNWIGTMWGGHLTFETPMLWALGFLYLFLIGGITGIILASPALDFNVQDTYFVVAHFHNTLIGGTVFAIFAATYYWFPKMTGRRLSEPLGRLHFVLWVVGFTLTFVRPYQLGLLGMPRRITDYASAAGWTELNALSTVGSIVLGLGVIPFLVAVWLALRHAPDAGDDPWGGYTLEWATTSPPPEHNFTTLPPIRSNRPLFDARMAAAAASSGATGSAVEARPVEGPS